MKVFISWSGAKSKRCAEELREWLPYINHGIETFVSSRDIEKGDRPLLEIAQQLRGTAYGIVCVTRENQSAPWINFEAGALSRQLDESVLVPFLLDMPVRDLSGPLTQFQAVVSDNKSDVLGMVRSLNSKGETPLDENRLVNTFDRFWPDLEAALDAIRAQGNGEEHPPRDINEILEELLRLNREQSAQIGHLLSEANDKSASSVINIQASEVRIDEDLESDRAKEAAAGIRRIIRDHKVRVAHARVIRRGGYCEARMTIESRTVSQEFLKALEAYAAINNVSIDATHGEKVYSFPPF